MVDNPSLSGNIAHRKIVGGNLLKLSVASCQKRKISQLKKVKYQLLGQREKRSYIREV